MPQTATVGGMCRVMIAGDTATVWRGPNATGNKGNFMKPLLLTSSLLAMIVVGAAPIWAQDTRPADADTVIANNIIVTGCADMGDITKAETNYSITNSAKKPCGCRHRPVSPKR